MSDSARWRINPRIRLAWRDWGHDSVAFESLSGITHQFDPLGAAVLSWLEERPCSADELCALLTPEGGELPEQTLREGITALIEMLARLGWIEPETPA